MNLALRCGRGHSSAKVTRGASWAAPAADAAALRSHPPHPRLRRRQVVYLRQHVGEPQGQCGQIAHMGASVDLLGEPVTEHLEGGEAVTAPCDVC